MPTPFFPLFRYTIIRDGERMSPLPPSQQSQEPQLATDTVQEDVEVVQTSGQLDTFAVS